MHRHIPHHLPMLAFHMTMQVRPTQTGYIAVFIWAIIPEQQNSVLEDLILFILDAQVVIGSSKVLLLETLETSYGIVGKDHKGRLSLDTQSRLLFFHGQSKKQTEGWSQANGEANLRDNEHSLCSCTVHEGGVHRYDTCGGCRARPRCVPPWRHR